MVADISLAQRRYPPYPVAQRKSPDLGRPPANPGGPFALSFVVDLPSGQPPGASLYVPNTRIDIFCDGHTLLPDGRTMTIGGTNVYDFLGYRNTEFFDFRDNSWSPGPFMSGGRWYGTLLTLASGEVLALSGEFREGYAIPDS